MKTSKRIEEPALRPCESAVFLPTKNICAKGGCSIFHFEFSLHLHRQVA